MRDDHVWLKLAELAQAEADTAARRAAAAQADLRQIEEKLALLEKYRHDYANRLSDSLANGMVSGGVTNFRAFMARLDEAITASMSSLGEARRRADAGVQEANRARRKLKSFEVLIERLRKQEATRVAKREQRQMDEFAARKSNAALYG